MRRIVFVAVLGLVTILPGCGMLRSLGSPGVDGYGREDESLRRLLSTGGYEQALLSVSPEKKAAPRDELLRLMYEGVAARHAGRYEESSRALEQASLIAEDRVTKSASRAALSTVTSDLALSYLPVDAERLLIHYYGALNYLDRGMLDDAAVEVRRLSHTLALLEGRGNGRTGLVSSPFLRYFAGSVFQAAGFEDEAEVSFRQAAALAEQPELEIVSERAAGTGEVVLLVETGFVAHPVEQSLNVLLGGDEVGAFNSADADDRVEIAAGIAARIVSQALNEPRGFGYGEQPRSIFVDAPAKSLSEARKCLATRGGSTHAPAPTATRDALIRPSPAVQQTEPPIPVSTGAQVAPRLPANAAEAVDSASAPANTPTEGDSAATATSRRKPARKPAPVPVSSGGCDDKDEDDDSNPYLLRMAWSVFVMPPQDRLSVEPVLDSMASGPVRLSADISAAVIDDYEERRTLMLARSVARAAAKMALTTGVEKKVSEKNEDLGKVLGLLTNAGTALLEQADTRSWHLLPGNVSLIRLQLPAGEHRVRLKIGTGDRTIEAPVTVQPGQVTIASTRIWQ